MRKSNRAKSASYFSVFMAMLAVFGLVVTVSTSVSFAQQTDTDATQDRASSATSSVVSTGVSETGVAMDESVIYLVRLQDPPIALYRGGINGIAPTSPVVNNTRGLELDSPAVIAYTDHLANQRANFVTDAEKALGRNLDVVYEYSVANNGMAVWLTPAEAAQVAQIDGVIFIKQDEEKELHTDNGPEWIGAPVVWDGSSVPSGMGTFGAGTVVGIIDTGINYSNPSFAEVGPIDGYVHTNPLGSGNFIGDCAPGGGYESYCNDKLIGVRGYATVNGGNPVDNDGHGSHVAGTAAGNFVTATVVAPTTAITRTISGVAPHANIIAYSACCTESALTAAIEDIVIDYATLLAADSDVRMSVNYSIGSTSPTANMWSDFDTAGYLAARDAGIFVATAAGNSGPGASTIGSPGDAPWLTTVGNSTHNRVWSNNLVDMSGGDTAAPANISGKGLTSGYGPADIVYAGDFPSSETATPELCGVGTIGDFNSPWPPGTFNGEIVVCDRGTYGRVEMGANVLAAGAGGYVLANHAAAGNALVGDAHELPGVHITYDDGVVLKAWLASGTGHMATITGSTINEDPSNGDIMSSSSSRGPNRALPDIVSPSVTAPGTDILAPYGTNNAISWDMISGTSMASPHVAGAAALLMATYPDWTPAEVQSALMLTAWQDMLKEDGATPADPFDMGSGRIDLTVAAQTGVVMDETTVNYENANPALGGDPKTLNLPSMGNATCPEVCEWTRTFRSVLPVAATYTATIEAPVGVTITVDPPVFTIPAGGTQTFTVTVDATGVPYGDWHFGQVNFEGIGAAVITPVEVLSYTGTTVGSPDTWGRPFTLGNGSSGSCSISGSGSNVPYVTEVFTVTTAGDYRIESAQNYDGYIHLYANSFDPSDQCVNLVALNDDGGAGSLIETVSLSDGVDYYLVTSGFGNSDTGDFTNTVFELVEGAPSMLPDAHLPIAFVPVEPVPIIFAPPVFAPPALEPNQTVTVPLTIRNFGALDLDWELFELGNAMLSGNNIASTGHGVIWDQPRSGNSGRINNFANNAQPAPAGIYQASAFTLLTDVELETIFMEGFYLGGSLATSTALNWYIYPDAAGNPAGNPEDGLNNHVWSYTANVGDAGVSIVDDNMSLDLLAAGETPVALSAGTYWLLAYPDIPTFSLGPNVLYAWFHSGTGIGRQISPAGLVGFPSSWGATPEGRAFRLEGQIDCAAGSDISWLSASPTSGTIVPSGQADIAMALDTTGLAEGVYTAGLCIASNDPASPLTIIQSTLTVVADPVIEVDAPAVISGTLDYGFALTETIVISNTGLDTLNWTVSEAPSLPSPALLNAGSWTEGFDDITDLPGKGWAQSNNSDPLGTTGWSQGSPTTFPAHSGDTNSYISANFNNTAGVGTISNWLLTPETTFRNGDSFSFWTRVPTGSAWADRLEVRWSGNGDSIDVGNSATSVGDFDTLLLEINPALTVGGYPDEWAQFTVDITGLAGPINGRIGFRYFVTNGGPSGSNSNYIGIDSFEYTPVSACDTPGSLSWVSANPASGATEPNESSSVDVTFDATGLPNGTYTGSLCVNSDDPATPVVEIPLSMTVENAPNANLRVGHLAPFDMDPATAVTVTLNATPVLTDFHFGESTQYISVPGGDHDVAIYVGSSMTPAISATVTLAPGEDYSALAVGGAHGWPVELQLHMDDNTAPAAGMAHVRFGHLAPFTSVMTDTLADIRTSGGDVVVDDVPYDTLAGYMPLPASEYDLQVTSADGSVVYMDLAPFTLNEGDILYAVAVGDGMNQDLGVFAWATDAVGMMLPMKAYGVEFMAETDALTGMVGTTVTYTVHVTNTGNVTDTFDMSVAGNDWTTMYPMSVTLGAGEMAMAYVTVDIPADATGGDSDMVTITATSQADASVMADVMLTTTASEVPMAMLRVAHLAPFAATGTEVTVRLNGTAVLTDFAYLDSTNYLTVPAGTHLVQVEAGATTVISAEVTLMADGEYTVVATGGANGFDVAPVVLMDDNTAPDAGKAHVRIGHLAPFADSLAGTAADVRLADGTVILPGVQFGDVMTGYLSLDAGDYDLQIVAAGTDNVLIDLETINLAEGDILYVFATGDGTNQPVGAFAYPTGAEGFPLPLKSGPMTYTSYLPIVVRP